MHISEDRILETVDGLYRAAVDQEWPLAMQNVIDLFGGAGGVIFEVDTQTGEFNNWIGHKLDSGEDEYMSRINSINPRMKYSMSKPAGHLAWDYRILPEEALNRHEFYHWLEQWDMKCFMGTCLSRTGNIAAFTSVEFSTRHGHVSQKQLDTYQKLLPHIGNAWRLSACSRKHQFDHDYHAFLLDQSKRGIITLDRKGRVLSLNAAAEEMVARADGLEIRNGSVHSARASDNWHLQRLIADALKACRGDTLSSGGTLPLTRHKKRRSYIVQIMPYYRAGKAKPDTMPGVVIFITDPDKKPETDLSVLAAIYKLTPKETLLAAALLGGCSLREAAEQNQVSYHTARSHLYNIFEKTGTHSQRQLMLLLSRL